MCGVRILLLAGALPRPITDAPRGQPRANAHFLGVSGFGTSPPEGSSLARGMQGRPAQAVLAANPLDPRQVEIVCGTLDELPHIRPTRAIGRGQHPARYGPQPN